MARSLEETRRVNREYQRRFRSENHERILADRAEFRAKNKVALRVQYREENLKRMYGITPEEYTVLFDQQGGCCAICGTKKNAKDGRRLAVDHDHTNGKIRGLLCNGCNRKLESLSFDGTGLFVNAMSYLYPGAFA